MDIEKIPMVRITWMDALDGETGWQDLDTMLKGELATCMDVGWMIKNNDYVWVAGHWAIKKPGYVFVNGKWKKKSKQK